jgi:hypothetical protein
MNVVTLTIDFSNGVEKRFSAVPWQQGMTILGALEAASALTPGFTIETASDRVGHAMRVVIDNVPSESNQGVWWVWVNARRGPERLGTETSFGFRPEEREANEVYAGDVILAKLVVTES